jgi:Calcineurin-like phosphoesterase
VARTGRLAPARRVGSPTPAIVLTALLTVAGLLASCGGGGEGGQAGTVIVAAGDISCATSGCAMDTANLFAGDSPEVDPAHVLALGDNQYQCGSRTEFQDRYGPSWGRSKSITWAVPGNHEYYTNLRYPSEPDCAGQAVGRKAAAGYFGYFGARANSPQQARCTASCDGWYFHDLDADGDGRADWRLIALNSGRCGENPIFSPRCSLGSGQETWLGEVALRRPPSCILAYWHHPRYTSDTTVHKDNAATDQFWRDLYAARADVVVNGHVHDYQRSVPLEPYGDGRQDDVNGIVEFVAGTGGAELHSFTAKGLKDPRFAARNQEDHGVLELTLHRTGYDWRFRPVGGSYDDHGTASCHA